MYIVRSEKIGNQTELFSSHVCTKTQWYGFSGRTWLNQECGHRFDTLAAVDLSADLSADQSTVMFVLSHTIVTPQGYGMA